MNARVAAAVLGACLCAAAPLRAVAQETADLTPPPKWMRQPVDTAHTMLLPKVKTVSKWTPAQQQQPENPTALYFAIGDSGGAALDTLAQKAISSVPKGARNVSSHAAKLCNNGAGLAIYYDLPNDGATPAVHVTELMGVSGTVVAVGAYVRPQGAPDDPAAMTALASLCPQSVTDQ